MSDLVHFIEVGNITFERSEQMENEKMERSGHMTNNMADVIWLGKQMERMRDGSQLADDMRFPDPIQFDSEDNDNDEKYNKNN